MLSIVNKNIYSTTAHAVRRAVGRDRIQAAGLCGGRQRPEQRGPELRSCTRGDAQKAAAPDTVLRDI